MISNDIIKEAIESVGLSVEAYYQKIINSYEYMCSCFDKTIEDICVCTKLTQDSKMKVLDTVFFISDDYLFEMKSIEPKITVDIATIKNFKYCEIKYAKDENHIFIKIDVDDGLRAELNAVDKESVEHVFKFYKKYILPKIQK